MTKEKAEYFLQQVESQLDSSRKTRNLIDAQINKLLVQSRILRCFLAKEEKSSKG